MDKKHQAIKEAKRWLQDNSFDAGHDLSHHQRVWELAREIANQENLKINKKALEIACMWHDVLINKVDEAKVGKRHQGLEQTLNYLSDYLHKINYPASDISLILLAVKHHEFNSNPVNLEGKVLYDADKLETLSLERIKRIIRSFDQQKMPKIALAFYIRVGKYRLTKMRKKLHFSYSRQVFDIKVRELTDSSEANSLTEKVGVNLKEFLPSVK
jgi:HD superfamily phosphohydrolase YqeK